MAKQKTNQQPSNVILERLQKIADVTGEVARKRAEADAPRREARAKLAAWLVAQGAPADAVAVLFPS